MKNKGRYGTILFSTVGMMVLILDSKTALQSASEGIELCIKTVIPSLFPFFVLSILLTSSLTGLSLPFLGPLSRLCGIPKGTESILLAGFLGGYPVGAQCVTQSWRSGQLSQNDARRMLGFCSNAGPAFIFGMTGSLFDNTFIPWSMWLIQMISAIIVGSVLPGKSESHAKIVPAELVSTAKTLERSVKVMGSVCGWVILFRMIIAICTTRILNVLPKEISVLFAGLMELANGCHCLNQVDSGAIRFVLCSFFLSFGGICVGMQTISVTAELGTGMYFPGKVMQSIVSILLAFLLSPLFFQTRITKTITICSGILLTAGIFFLYNIKIGKNNSRNATLQHV